MRVRCTLSRTIWTRNKQTAATNVIRLHLTHAAEWSKEWGPLLYPEEIEEALKTHPDVEDALVVGVPDERWGQAVTGVIVPMDPATFDEAALREHVKSQLAPYKAPKRILISEVPLRAPNGKADYKSVTDFARAALGDTADAK